MQKLIFIFFIAAALYSEPSECIYLPSAKRYLAPEHYSCNSNFYGSFDFLYWEGTERGLEYALKNATTPFHEKIEIYEPAFDFEPAFRIALGTHLPFEDWDLEFDYTRFYNHTVNHAHHDFGGNPNGGIRAVWTSSVAFQGNNASVLWQNAEAKWQIHANFFDLFLKTQLYLSPAISLVPAFGLKMALLNQKYNVLYENGNEASATQFISSSINMKNQSFNLGPTTSLATRWNIGDHFEILASLSGALLSTRFHIGRNESDVSFDGTRQLDSIREGSKYWAIRPQTAILFGFRLRDYACRHRSVLEYGFSAAYEAQVWWKQNMLFRFIDQTNAAMIAPTQGNLFFHGLNLEFYVDF